jgi:hypothetical protein
MAPRKRETKNGVTQARYTERAIASVRRQIPRIVYLPAALRGHNQTLTLDGLQVRITGPQITDNHARIAEADPLGHLIAVMNGLPIPRFIVEDGPDGGDATVRVVYHTPTVEEQRDAAKWLAARVTFKHPGAYTKGNPAQRQHSDDYAAMIEEAASRAAPDEDEN